MPTSSPGRRPSTLRSSGSTRAIWRPSRSTSTPSSTSSAGAPRDRIVVAESGVESRAQGAAAELAGADAILVGSALMRAPDPAAKLAELLRRPLVKVCGLTRDEDVAVAADAGADMAGFVLAEGSPRRAARGPRGSADDALGGGGGRRAARRAAQISSSSIRARRERCGAGTPCSCGRGTRSPASSTSPGRRPIPRTSTAHAPPKVASCSPAGSAPRTSPRRSRP